MIERARTTALTVPTAEVDHGPTALRMSLGLELRGLREARRMTREQAGDVIRGSAAKISRMELGRVGLKPRDVADLLTAYGVADGASGHSSSTSCDGPGGRVGGTATPSCSRRGSRPTSDWSRRPH
jgi:hypothetical protein